MISPTPQLIPRAAFGCVQNGKRVLPTRLQIHAPDFPNAARFLAEKLGANGFSVSMGAVSPAIRIVQNAHFEREAYELSIAPDAIEIRAGDESGAFYGAVSLLQLLPPQIWSAGRKKAPRAGWRVPCAEIRDAPRFGWRGLHLDCARHFFPKDEILRLLDALALHKLNVFHWHLTDAQGWRFESKKYPLLTQIGAWRRESERLPREKNVAPRFDGTPHGGFYTQEEMREVVAYAARLHITVVPEIEMPGHAAAALAAYPFLSCDGKPREVAREMAGVVPDAFCAGNHEVFEFLETILGEVLEIFPSPFIHIGGDECVKTAWGSCPKCQARMVTQNLRDENELQADFLRRIARFLSLRGRRMLGWDEILEGGFTQEAGVMFWRDWAGADHEREVLRSGAPVVMTPNGRCYFDINPGNDQPVRPSVHRASAILPLRHVYEWEVVPAGLEASNAAKILGGQANMWTESITSRANLEWMLFPRLCALAERVWSTPEARDWSEFSGRLSGHLARLEAAGVNFRPLGNDFDWEEDAS